MESSASGRPVYLTLQIKEARKTLSSADFPSTGAAMNLLSSASVKAAFFPNLEDL